MDKKFNILIVEDNQDDYEATVRCLRKYPVIDSIAWCRNGQCAIDHLWSKFAPDLILLDLNMPGLDGRQVLDRVKNDTVKRLIPVVIMTTSKDAKDVNRCYEIGANTYIQKPVDFLSLKLAIDTILNYWFEVAILPGNEDDI